MRPVSPVLCENLLVARLPSGLATRMMPTTANARITFSAWRKSPRSQNRNIAYIRASPRLSQRPRLSEKTTGTIDAAIASRSTSFHPADRVSSIAQIAQGVRIAKADPQAFV